MTRPNMSLPARGNRGASCFAMTATGVPAAALMCRALVPRQAFVASTVIVAAEIVVFQTAFRSAGAA